MNEVLTNANFMLYAARYYDNPSCLDVEEFNEDLARIKYIKRLFNKFQETGELKERLIVNHLIVFYNMFGTVPASRMLFLKLGEYAPLLAPFLIFINRFPDTIDNLNTEGSRLYTSSIPLDNHVVRILRETQR
jgi:hypothetical protein